MKKLLLAAISLLVSAMVYAGPGDFGGWTYGNNGQITGVVSLKGIITPIPLYISSGTIVNALCSDANGNIIQNAGANCYGPSGPANITSGTIPYASTAGGNTLRDFQNRGSLSSNFQIASSALSSNNAGTPTYTSVDTGTTQTLSFVAQIATATDYMVLESAAVELFY